MRNSSPSLPRMLGRYALYEKIASGGMGSVHLGRLVGPVGFARTVAIKRMHAQFAENAEFVSMFLDEARLAARIRHPNVVPTLDVVAMNGELFLVMDFVQGESLARLMQGAAVREERIPPAMVATIMVGVLHGLHAAHEAKSERGEPLEVVHRDVSPQNVLVGVDGVARVLDFGVAKAAGRLQTTREGQLKGKIGYMAPEQLRGVATRATDVYAAAVVLWEALAGRRLLCGENEWQVFAQARDGCTTPPSRYAPGLPPALDEVTMCGLRVDPAKRYPTAREMACALEDAIIPAPASKLGDWVERAAKTTLDERNARVAVIESDSLVLRPLPPAMPGDDRDSRPAIELEAPAGAASAIAAPATAVFLPNAAAPLVAPQEENLVLRSGGSVSYPGRSPLARVRPSPGWVAAVGAFVLLGGAALWTATHGGGAQVPFRPDLPCRPRPSSSRRRPHHRRTSSRTPLPRCPTEASRRTRRPSRQGTARPGLRPRRPQGRARPWCQA